jgi:hypothetical protein
MTKVIDQGARQSILELAQMIRVIAGVYARIEHRPETSEMNDRVQRDTAALDARLKESE